MNPPTPVPILDFSSSPLSPSSLEGLSLSTRQRPLLLRGLPLGRCLSTWTSPSHLSSSVPSSKLVVAHSSSTPDLNFISKNYAYVTLPFSQLVSNCSSPSDPCDPSFWYLRSLGEDPRGRDVSDLSLHFPQLASEFALPPGLFPEELFFSSVFRISSPSLRLWTHYDICANVLVQVVGRKRVLLWPPGDALNLYLIGDKSQVLDPDTPDLEKYPKLKELRRTEEAFLEPGDILFIPPLWFHNVTALTYSISVNVFWKGLSERGGALYDKKDTYGNKDLIPAQLALRTVEKGTSLLAKSLPPEYEDFYLRRIIISIQKRLDALQPLLNQDDKDPNNKGQGPDEGVEGLCLKEEAQDKGQEEKP